MQEEVPPLFRMVDAEAEMYLRRGLTSISARDLTSHDGLRPEGWNLKLAVVRREQQLASHLCPIVVATTG